MLGRSLAKKEASQRIATDALAQSQFVSKLDRMTGVEVIDQIKRLSKDERQKVIDFARHADAQRLSPDELGDIARRMMETPDQDEAQRLREEFMRGFYGSELPHA